MSTEMTIIVSLISVVATGFLGLVGWYLLEWRQNYVVRKTVKIYLIDVLIPVVKALKDPGEDGDKSLIDKMIDFVDVSKGESVMKTSYYPLFNSDFFKAFPENRLMLAHKKKEKYVALLEVKGYLDGFQGRMPHQVQKNWVDFINDHQQICKTNIETCRSVRHETRIYQSNLESSREMAERLMIEINKVIE
jgi:hypothetical protein